MVKMYFDMTYEDYLLHCFLRWLEIAKSPATRPHNVTWNDKGYCRVRWQPGYNKAWVVLEFSGRWVENGDGEQVRKSWSTGQLNYPGDPRAALSIGQGLGFTQSDAEVQAAMLLAIAMQDHEAAEVFEFFLEMGRNPRLKYAYATSERRPSHMSRDEYPWKCNPA